MAVAVQLNEKDAELIGFLSRVLQEKYPGLEVIKTTNLQRSIADMHFTFEGSQYNLRLIKWKK